MEKKVYKERLHLTKEEIRALHHMLFVYEVHISSRPSWVSDYLHSLDIERVEVAREALDKVFRFK